MNRREAIAQRWRVAVDTWSETPSSEIGYGSRDGQHVVLKVVKRPGDEWQSGRVVHAFGGRGMVRALEFEEGAVLLERLDPGDSLVDLVRQGRDDDATEIIAHAIGALSPGAAPTGTPRVDDWGRGFAWYRACGDTRIARDLVDDAGERFGRLVATQQHVRLIHGDLQHYNVLSDRARGWTVIDPKGVIGEVEYEIGAVLRNPGELPDSFLDEARLQRRTTIVSTILNLDPNRVLEWTYAQAVLSAIWCVQDDSPLDADNAALRLATLIRPML